MADGGFNALDSFLGHKIIWLRDPPSVLNGVFSIINRSLTVLSLLFVVLFRDTRRFLFLSFIGRLEEWDEVKRPERW